MKSDKLVVIYDPVDKVYYSKRTHNIFTPDFKNAKVYHKLGHAKATITSNASDLDWCYGFSENKIVRVGRQKEHEDLYNRWKRCIILHIGNIVVEYLPEPVAIT